MSVAIKKYFSYVKESIPEIFKAVVVVVLLGSGVLVAAFLYSQLYDGVTILFAAGVVEAVGVVILLFIGPRGFLFQFETEEEEEEEIEDKGRKSKRK